MARDTFKTPFTLRPYQTPAVEYIERVAAGLLNDTGGNWHLMSAPTGTGKSLIELEALSRVPGSILVTPRLEIIAGMCSKMGHYVDGMGDNELAAFAWKYYGVTTPIRLRNLLIKGELPYAPSLLIVDEAHHDLAQTYQDVTMFLNGVPKVGLTATPYRGTPRGTSEFLKQWGDTVVTILTLRDAVRMGAYQMPDVQIWPLIDDDTIDVSAGEFKVTSVTSAVKESSAHIAHLSRDWFDRSTRLYDMATLYAVPSTDAVNDMVARLRDAGLPAVAVTQDTPRVDRIKAFELTEQCRAALVQISVVSEGVDLKIRRVVDAKSTLSPNAWFQLVGRIRPDDSGAPPEYICCNRNVERHCYLWEGLLPNSKVQEAQTAFTDDTGEPRITQRAGMRVVGLEGLGKFVKVPIFLLDGTIGFMYNIVHVHENRRTEYIAFVHPNYPEPVYGVKESAHDGVEMKWGKWRVVDALPELRGCASAKASTLTPKQQERWDASAENFGLDPNRRITGREFQILPFLMNTGLRF